MKHYKKLTFDTMVYDICNILKKDNPNLKLTKEVQIELTKYIEETQNIHPVIVDY